MDYVARAGAADMGGAGMNIVVVAIALLVGVAIASLLPAVLAWQRRGPQVEIVPTAATVWFITAAFVSVYDLLAFKRWQDEYRLRLMTGYLESSDTTGAPALHLKLYAGLAAWYLVMLVLSLRRGPPAPPASAPPPPPVPGTP